mmetsp:Transcript_75799/g.232016  ORF Transcript_75799/g.232016 Transcript_75799/m.232016 type:complete len:212 (+) Transcript_75799:1232-1867(+)
MCAPQPVGGHDEHLVPPADALPRRGPVAQGRLEPEGDRERASGHRAKQHRERREVDTPPIDGLAPDGQLLQPREQAPHAGGRRHPEEQLVDAQHELQGHGVKHQVLRRLRVHEEVRAGEAEQDGHGQADGRDEEGGHQAAPGERIHRDAALMLRLPVHEKRLPGPRHGQHRQHESDHVGDLLENDQAPAKHCDQAHLGPWPVHARAIIVDV